MNVDATIILDSAQDALFVSGGSPYAGKPGICEKRIRPPARQTRRKRNEASEEAARGQSGSSGQGQSGVPDGFEAVQGETGIINDDYVQILSGLSEGDEVYVDPDRLWHQYGYDDDGPRRHGRRNGRRAPAAEAAWAAAPDHKKGVHYEKTSAGKIPLIQLKDIYKIYQMGDEGGAGQRRISLPLKRESLWPL